MLSFKLRSLPRERESAGPLRVLVTGAGGSIGRYFVESVSMDVEMRLMVHNPDGIEELEEYGEVVCGDLLDRKVVRSACEGMQAVLHLAADPSPDADWESLLPSNIESTYNLLAAAVEAGCGKVLYASSIHAISGYPAGVQVKTSDPVNPGDLYGATKCFGEALGRYFSTQKGLAFYALRIGAFQPVEAPLQGKSIAHAHGFVSRRDLQQLIELCLKDNKLEFAILQALSANTFNRMDISSAEELLGYSPQDDFFELHPVLRKAGISTEVIAHNESDD